MIIAIPIWQGRVSPVMDTASRLLVIEMEDGKEASKKTENMPRSNTIHLARYIGGLGVDVVLCGAISHQLESSLTDLGIEVVPCIKGGAEEIVSAYSNGNLNNGHFFLPTCRYGRGRRGGGRHRGHQHRPGLGKYRKEDS